jgi:hypothetical protein
MPFDQTDDKINPGINGKENDSGGAFHGANIMLHFFNA